MNKIGLSRVIKQCNPATADLLECLQCAICHETMQRPTECLRCRHCFCGDCIERWRRTSDFCPFKCSERPMQIGSATLRLQKTLCNVELRCAARCGEWVRLGGYFAHVRECGRSPCANTSMCVAPPRFVFEERRGCSIECLNGGAAVESGRLTFDLQRSSPRLRFAERSRFAADNLDDFASAYSRLSFLPTRHCFRLNLKNATRHFKVGFAAANATAAAAFSDSEHAFGYYSIGQTRSGSDESGFAAGEALPLSAQLRVEIEIDFHERAFTVSSDGRRADFWNDDFDRFSQCELNFAVAIMGICDDVFVEILTPKIDRTIVEFSE